MSNKRLILFLAEVLQKQTLPNDWWNSSIHAYHHSPTIPVCILPPRGIPLYMYFVLLTSAWSNNHEMICASTVEIMSINNWVCSPIFRSKKIICLQWDWSSNTASISLNWKKWERPSGSQMHLMSKEEAPYIHVCI